MRKAAAVSPAKNELFARSLFEPSVTGYALFLRFADESITKYNL